MVSESTIALISGFFLIIPTFFILIISCFLLNRPKTKARIIYLLYGERANNQWSRGGWIGPIDAVIGFQWGFAAALNIRWFPNRSKKHPQILHPNLNRDNNHEKLLSEFKLLFWLSVLFALSGMIAFAFGGILWVIEK